MIFGEVSDSLEARVSLLVFAQNGMYSEILFTIDTGFSGFLTLPSKEISELSLEFLESQVFVLGNNLKVNFDVYEAQVALEGYLRDVLVLESESGPLVGMSLLSGHRVTIDVRRGGLVEISS